MIDDTSLDGIIDAVAPVLGLRVDAAWHESVRAHLGISLRHALAVAAFDLPDEFDPAPVFHA